MVSSAMADLMEGITSDRFPGRTFKVGKTIYLYGDNKISLDGPTSKPTEDVPAVSERMDGKRLL